MNLIENHSLESNIGTPESSVLRQVEAPQYSPGTIQFEDYMSLRARCGKTSKLQTGRIAEIQERVREWLTDRAVLPVIPDYANYSQEVVSNKVGGLIGYLRANFGEEIPEIELETTEAFVASAFTMYGERSNTGEVHEDADGSFAFVVPVRLSRERPEYGQEVETAIPAFRYLPNELRADMLIGLPPLVIDTYKRGPDGRRGYVIFTPIYTDIKKDMQKNPRAMIGIIEDKINDAVDFAQERLGVEVAGLGAVIPSLTNYGKNIRNKKVVVTTGHGGTAYIVKETANKAVNYGLTSPDAIKKIGLMGLGSIGASIACLMAKEFPESEIRIFDPKQGRVDRTANALNNGKNTVIACDSDVELIQGSDMVISAITVDSQINLEDTPYKDVDMKGKIIIDDGQPAAFNIEQVEAREGVLVWPIGHDNQELVVRNDFDYGTMYDANRDLFGCEAEAATLHLYAQDMRARGLPSGVVRRVLEKVAIRSAVTPHMARLMGVLFRHKSGIGLARPQAFGRAVDPPVKEAI